MFKSILAAIMGLFFAVSPSYADSPNYSLYLINTKKLKTLIKNNTNFKNIPNFELIRNCEINASYDRPIYDLSISTPIGKFTYKRGIEAQPRLPGEIGEQYIIFYSNNTVDATTIVASGKLVVVDDRLNSISTTNASEITNSNISATLHWQQQEYTLIITFVNAKR